MPTTDREASREEACQTSRQAIWPEERVSENPQASYYRARYYDPAAARFLSEDSIRTVERSLYAYVENNPVVLSDPTGLHSIYFDGSYIRVFDDEGRMVLRCRGTTGKKGTAPQNQNAINVGPIPTGHYFALPEEFSGGGMRAFMRDLFGNWGTWRVPLHPFPGTNTFGRTGFFIHGGEHPGSAGCINIQHCDQELHNLLQNHAGPIGIEVNYVGFQPF